VIITVPDGGLTVVGRYASDAAGGIITRHNAGPDVAPPIGVRHSVAVVVFENLDVPFRAVVPDNVPGNVAIPGIVAAHPRRVHGIPLAYFAVELVVIAGVLRAF